MPGSPPILTRVSQAALSPQESSPLLLLSPCTPSGLPGGSACLPGCQQWALYPSPSDPVSFPGCPPSCGPPHPQHKVHPQNKRVGRSGYISDPVPTTQLFPSPPPAEDTAGSRRAVPSPGGGDRWGPPASLPSSTTTLAHLTPSGACPGPGAWRIRPKLHPSPGNTTPTWKKMCHSRAPSTSRPHGKNCSYWKIS